MMRSKRELTDREFAAYLAGFTDGEGYIGVRARDNVAIVLANCVPEVLEWIKARLGYGAIYSSQQKPHWRRRYVLKVSSAVECRDFLLRTQPYLLIKAEKATLALARIHEMQMGMDALDARNRQIVRLATSGRRHKDIAHRFGVSQQLVSRIIRGSKWPSEIRRRRMRTGVRTFLRSEDQVFRLHGLPKD